MSDDVVTAMIARQRRRLIASILGHAERELYEDLTEEQQKAFRKKVITSVGVFADFAMDVVRSANEGYWVNEDAMTLLADISEQVRNLTADA